MDDESDLQRALAAMIKIHGREWRAHLPANIDDLDFTTHGSAIKLMTAATSRHLVTEIAYAEDLVILTKEDFRRHLAEAYTSGRKDVAQNNMDRRLRALERRYEEEKAAQAAGRRNVS